ncbi:MAG: hypothetical protein PHG23_02640 [Candidatus Pacebacteria bacterium]|nr:hypothetical protein [Candidatus Paceibacterota bacterium]
MDILNNPKQKLNFDIGNSKPILFVGLILILGAVGFLIYQKSGSSLELISPSAGEIQTRPINIDYEFLKSAKFEALETFPSYPDFQPSTGEGVPAGRANPFLPPAGLHYTTPGESTPAQ